MNLETVGPTRVLPGSSSAEWPHFTVLRQEVLDLLGPESEQLYIDATLGAGGHAEAILEVPGTRVVGLDQDEGALRLASSRLARFGDRVTLVHGRFGSLEEHLAVLGVKRARGLVADVGVSSMQLDQADRGMSFRSEGPLDMRMDRSRGETAIQLIERVNDDELANLIFRYGDERRSRRIARCIKQAQAQRELATTRDLRRAVIRAVGPVRVGGIDPATRTFQALRIAVNGELDELASLLATAPRILDPGGVAAIISFHSHEDRLVKHGLRDGAVWKPLTKKPVLPTDGELAQNARSRSAKLRAARRLPPESSSDAPTPDRDTASRTSRRKQETDA